MAGSDRVDTTPVRVVGSYLSPYVRKVLVILHHKGIPYEIDPIVPFFGGEEFERLSPLRRVPVLIDGPLALADSTVICEYLEERTPEPAMFPSGPAARARARWLEEYADSRMGQVFIWQLFDALVIRRFVWKEPVDEEAVRRAREVEIPRILDQLEAELPAEGTLFGGLCVADVALASFFRNAAFVGIPVDAQRWPRTAGFVSRVLDHPAFARLQPFEELSLRTPIADQRRVLREAGAPIAAETLGTPAPRRGVPRT